jgi:hypothetical protein
MNNQLIQYSEMERKQISAIPLTPRQEHDYYSIGAYPTHRALIH